MSDLSLHNDWDLEFGADGDLMVNSGARETAQAAKWNCLTITNDMFDRVEDGIPYFSEMFTPTVERRVKVFYLEQACYQAPRVSLVNVLEFDSAGNVAIDIYSNNQELRIKL